MSYWIDVHCHLNMLPTSLDETLKLAEGQQVKQMVTIGTEPKDHEFVWTTAEKYYPKIFCTLGVHPHQAQYWSEDVRDWILQKAASPWVIALGEMGLDYYYNHNPKERQIEVFHAQMELASQLGLPVQIHSRDAEEDTLAVLQHYKTRVRGIIHCFTGSYEMAKKALDLGFFISISGVMTFKNAHDLRETIRKLPNDVVTLETDAPFLAPVPYRGQKNTPAYVASTAKHLSDLWGVELERLKAQVSLNTQKIFPKWQLLART
ncbi:MAG: TatD family hydrolase [Bdellovibrionaceae bacterium]|jgi:TatD DNase family protein|nr:TatD family hydrolase [Pseudobdellovibrionaceae bacterium]